MCAGVRDAGLLLGRSIVQLNGAVIKRLAFDMKQELTTWNAGFEPTFNDRFQFMVKVYPARFLIFRERRQILEHLAMIAPNNRVFDKQVILIQINVWNLNPCCFTYLHADELLRVLSNLLDNAILASTNGGDIRLSHCLKEETAIIRIQDHGRGISDDVLRRIGEKGFTSRETEKENGTGLGVYSAKKRLEGLGGSISYQSQLGVGTTVSISFPATVVIKSISADLVMIDDENMNRLVWKFRATELGKKVQFFASIEEFIESEPLIARETPIFLDSDLGGGVKGEDFAPTLKAHGFKHVFLATSHVHLHGKTLTGISDVIDKSFDRAVELIERLQS